MENKKLSVNVVDESWLKEADRMGVISGNKEDKSEAFAYTMGENGAPLINDAKISIECEPVLFEFLAYEYFKVGEKVGDCAKMN